MYKDLLDGMYTECFNCGTTKEFDNAFDVIIPKVPIGQEAEIEDTIISAVDAECFEAFKEGFRTAMKLVAGKD